MYVILSSNISNKEYTLILSDHETKYFTHFCVRGTLGAEVSLLHGLSVYEVVRVAC